MVKGNLLLESETFRIEDDESHLFAARIEALNLTVDKCRENGDTIFGKGDLSYVEFLNLPLFEYCDPEKFVLISERVPGLTRDMYVFLTNHLLNYDNLTKAECTCLNDIERQFPGNNNGVLGLESDRFDCEQEFAVFDEKSWQDWKVGYLARHPEYILWKNEHPHLPNLQYSNQLLGQECQKRFGGNGYLDFYNHAGIIAGNDKSALAIEVGKTIAESNFYQYHEALSKLNQERSGGRLRNIYHLTKQNRSLYLSIDVEKASFEVCDHTGDHLGEYLFDGRKQGGADTNGNHNIII